MLESETGLGTLLNACLVVDELYFLDAQDLGEEIKQCRRLTEILFFVYQARIQSVSRRDILPLWFSMRE